MHSIKNLRITDNAASKLTESVFKKPKKTKKRKHIVDNPEILAGKYVNKKYIIFLTVYIYEQVVTVFLVSYRLQIVMHPRVRRNPMKTQHQLVSSYQRARGKG